MRPPIFIVGLPRSGSTLWSKILARNPSVTLFKELHYLNPWRRDFRSFLRRECGDLSQDKNIRKLVAGVMNPAGLPGISKGRSFWMHYRKLEANGISEALYQSIRESDRSIGSIFRSLIDEATRCRGYERAIVKFPVYPAYLGKLAEWYPDAKIVHITRDPRAIAVSKSSDPGGAEKLIERHPWMQSVVGPAGKWFAVLQYTWASRVHRRFQGQPFYRLFQYEDLLVDPRAVVTDLCNFCNLEFSESMLTPDQGQKSSLTGERSSGFDASRATHWQSAISHRESRLIQWITSGSMKRMQYDPDSHPIFRTSVVK